MSDISIRVCMGPGGIASGGGEVLSAFETLLKQSNLSAEIKDRCSTHKVGCLGMCSKDVLVDLFVDGKKTTYQKVNAGMVQRIVDEHIIQGAPIAEWITDEEYDNFYSKQIKVVLSDCGVVDPESLASYVANGGYKATDKVLKTMSPIEVTDVMTKSGLRGRGGAGFPTGLKWETCRKVPSSQKYIICNADEGDPGAFMDRAVLEGNPHAVIEGMLIGAYAIGADKGYVYVRAEYPLAVERLSQAIKEATTKGFLGENIMNTGFNFSIKLKLGAGAFVCGEETALIASIEGQRGMPRPKPPFPVFSGLWGKPTVINNVETLANIAYIITKGAEWYASYGTEKSKGTKVFALAGKIARGGLADGHYAQGNHLRHRRRYRRRQGT